MTDRELLAGFAASRDERALAEIIARHGPMVFSTCQRILGDLHGAEDATQAVFIALARKAPALSLSTILAGWLFRAAERAALCARRERERRVRREQEAAAMRERAESAASWEEVRPHLGAALSALPDVQRDAVVLRYLENRPVAEVALEMRASEAATEKRLSRALSAMRERLARHGVSVPVMALGGILVENVGAVAAPAGLVASIQSVCLGKAAASTAAMEIGEGVMKAMLWTKVKLAAAVLATVGAITASSPIVYRALAADVPAATAPAASAPTPKLPAQVVADALCPTDPSGVRMDGWLGYRVRINRLALGDKLFHVYLTKVFSNRANNAKYTDWGGEYAGKTIQGASFALNYAKDFPDVAAKLDRNAPFQTRNFAFSFDPKKPDYRTKLDTFAKTLMAAQEPDGYLGCYPPEQRYIIWDIWSHKYNMLGLLTYYQATGDKAALEACRKMALRLAEDFGEGKKDIVLYGPGTIDKDGNIKGDTDAQGMASTSVLEPLALTYEYTGEKKILELCQYIVNRQEENPGSKLLSRKDVHHKAYEALSVTTGLCELYRATGDKRYLDAALTQWQYIRDHHRYCHGAITGNNEHLGKADTWPLKGTCEGCITVTWLHLNWQLLRLTGEAQFADEIHRLAYNFMGQAQNCFNGGWDHCGLWASSRGEFSCCGASGWRAPPLLPMLAVMGGARHVAVNLYESGAYGVKLGDGTAVKLTQKTEYPWSGDVEIAVDPAASAEFELRLLLPFFFKSGSIQVNGKDAGATMAAGSYAVVKRKWSAGDKVTLRLDMPLEVERFKAYPGMVAFRLGPQYLASHPDLPPAGEAKPGWKAPAFELVKLPFEKWTGDKDSRPNTWRGWEGTRLVRAYAETVPGEPARTFMLAPVCETGGVQYLTKDGAKTEVTVWRPEK